MTSRLRKAAPLLVTGLAAIGLGAVLYTVALTYFLSEEQDRLSNRNSLYAATLIDALERFQYLPTIVAEDRRISAALGGATDQANARLVELARRTGVEAIYLMDPTGFTIAASNHAEAGSFLGQNYGFRPYFRAAIEGGIGEFYAIGATTLRPGYFIAAPVRIGGRISAVVAVKLDLNTLPQTWADSGEVVLVANADGVVVLSSDEELRYRSLAPIPQKRMQEIAAERQFGREDLKPLVWRTDDDGGAVLEGDRFVHVAAPLNRRGWTLHVLHDRSRVEERALLALIVYGVVLALAALAYVYARSRRISAALRSSQDLNERLEAEISERKAAETTLQRTQNELARSERLAALGRLAASVTHELGQPLSAMRNYLAAADVTGETAELGGRLEAVVKRMETTTKQLRSFARQGDEALTAVDLSAVLTNAIDLTAHDFRAAGVAMDFTEPNMPVRVHGDAQRLEQVCINLLRNAMLAVDGADSKRVTAKIIVSDGVSLTITDTGPGVGDATIEALAEPFFTTREAGMGLGLAISSAIIKEHGGVLRAGNGANGGAGFAVDLPLEETS